MKKTILKKFILLAVIIFSMIPAQSQELVSIPRINGDIKFDGTVDDACWQKIQAAYTWLCIHRLSATSPQKRVRS